MSKMSLSISLMMRRPDLVPPVKILVKKKYGEFGYVENTLTGKVRFSRKKGCAIVVVERPSGGPELYEFSYSAISRAVNNGEVLHE